ncbi:MAG: LysE family translocator, partial [Rhizobacter sp.]|nr:LysE family translocator [Rhizobacter sp.]
VANAAGQPASNPLQRLFIVCAVMALFALGSNLTYALVGTGLRRWLATGERLTWFNRLMALLLLGTAAWMLRA